MKCVTCGLWHRGKDDQQRAHKLKMERDLYRQRAIDEVADHRLASRQAATFDVDLEVERHTQGVRL